MVGEKRENDLLLYDPFRQADQVPFQLSTSPHPCKSPRQVLQ